MRFHKESIEFNLAEDFSPFCGGRHDEDSYFSADSLKRHLFYLLQENANKIIVVNFDGTMGISSAFLHELVAHTDKEYLDRLVFTSTKKSYLEELTKYNKNVIVRHISSKETFWQKVRTSFYD